MIDFLKKTLHDFLIITAGIHISATVFCFLFIPGHIFTIGFMWQIIAMAFFSSLLHFIFYSRKEISKRQMLIRQIIHGCVLLALLLTIAHVWGWIDMGNAAQLAIFIIMIGCVYLAVTFLSFHHDKKIADKLNTGLRKYKSKEFE